MLVLFHAFEHKTLEFQISIHMPHYQTFTLFSKPQRFFRVNISLERKLVRNQCLLALSVFAQLFQAFVDPLIV